MANSRYSSQRRYEFPNWTWAGWKMKSRITFPGNLSNRGRYSPNWVDGGRSRIRICVKFPDIPLDWEHDQVEILHRSIVAKRPPFLQLCGLTFAVHPIREVGNCGPWVNIELWTTDSSRTFEMKVGGPRILLNSTYKAILMLKGTSQGQEGAVRSLLVMKLAGKDHFDRLGVA